MTLTLNSFVEISNFVLGNPITVIFGLTGKKEVDEAHLGLIDNLKENFDSVKFGKISPLGPSEVSAIKQFDLKELPTVLLFICEDLKPVEVINGYNPGLVFEKIENIVKSKGNSLKIPTDLNQKIKILTNFKSMVIFMKGIKEEPFCKFSRALVQLLSSINVVNYAHYNIFEDEEIRQGLKDYHNWPTFPQICINGEFIGGYDIVQEMNSNNELISEIPKDAFLDN
ncbi:glutaredoxin-like protein [Cryptosporidium ryanae]|uniref:glutaredoxin-like protein n=1 Tax=Cryptosporidium ryanae TaxID=515981 RepID=UPI00351A54F8|nr:glutaredoxin-like protein [Cryptosporidium ryanae]